MDPYGLGWDWECTHDTNSLRATIIIILILLFFVNSLLYNRTLVAKFFAFILVFGCEHVKIMNCFGSAVYTLLYSYNTE